MFVLKRNQIIITALVIMIAVAGWLSWNDTRGYDDIIGFRLDDQGNVAALIPESGALVGLFPEDYPGLGAAPWTITHDPAIAVSGDDYYWSGLAGLDLSEIIALPTNENYLTEAGEAIFVNQSRESSFFVQARLNREQNRSLERSILTELINNNNVEQEQRARAADQMLEIQRRIERETASEALIESKGFNEVYVRISDNAVDVIVSQETLTEAELAQIMDIIKRKTGVNETQIYISPMRR
ncbi:MAG: SpoIIIAH-like family protein [Defluviitaleaceae bacterium]|nr:SpoIIIAH-like family protein [Defluviitaleaceae bacterium]